MKIGRQILILLVFFINLYVVFGVVAYLFPQEKLFIARPVEYTVLIILHVVLIGLLVRRNRLSNAQPPSDGLRQVRFTEPQILIIPVIAILSLNTLSVSQVLGTALYTAFLFVFTYATGMYPGQPEKNRTMFGCALFLCGLTIILNVLSLVSASRSTM